MMTNLKDSHIYMCVQELSGWTACSSKKQLLLGWSSLDLIIEQVLMRSVETTGGLTQGRGILSEIQWLVWLLSMPACAEVNRTMQDLPDVNYTTWTRQNKPDCCKHDYIFCSTSNYIF